MKEEIRKEFNKLVEGENKTPFLALLFVTIILFIYCYFGSYSFFEQTFPDLNNLNYYKIIYHNCMSFVLFFVLGIVFSKFIMKKSLKEMGLGLGEKKIGIYLILIATLIIPIFSFTVLLDDGLKSTYPLIDFSSCSALQIVVYFLSYLLYYFGWEFLFRGILLFGTKDRFGVLGAILVTTLISALIHTSIAGFGKPMMETLSAVFAGIIFAFVTYRTNSIYYSLYFHFLVGVCTDVYIYFLA